MSTPDLYSALAGWALSAFGWRRALGISVVLAATLGGFPALQGSLSGEVRAAERPREPTCARLDEAASDAIVRLVQGGQKSDLRAVADAVFRMRRARRNCLLGWQRLACLDYQAIIHGEPGVRNTWLPSSFECSAPDGETLPHASVQFGWPARE